MAADTFVHWGKNRPTRAQLRMVLEDYVRDLGTVKWDKDRFYVTIPGNTSWPFVRLLADTSKAKASVETSRERWFEVYVDSKSIDIITRQMDALTNNIATGFATLAAQYWEGVLEE